jgi:hypothetical protein
MPKATRREMDAARQLVRERDGERCTMCGRWLFSEVRRSIHHRLPKGMGGSAKLENASNLVQLCGLGNADGCHGMAHSNPLWARKHGWIVPRSFDPAGVAVDMWDGWHYLSDDGSRTPCAPPNEVAG